MMENEANAANVTEIETRIERLAGKIRDLVPGTQAHTDIKEDMEDYYDRLIQIKQMRVDTLEETLKESLERETDAQKRAEAHANSIYALIFLCTVLVLSMIETVYPGLVSFPLNALIHACIYSTPGIAMLCIVITYVATKNKLV
jgi:uncharacterized membrane protein YhdT